MSLRQPARLTSLASLASRLPERPTFVLHSGCAEPALLTSWLAQDAPAFPGACVYSMMPMGAARYGEASACDYLRVSTFFPGKGLRAAVTAGRVTALRLPLSAIPEMFSLGRIRADAVLLQVSPPDQHGHVSLGVSVDYMHAALRQRSIVIAEINPRMPRTCGDTSIHVSEIDFFVDNDAVPQTLERGVPDDIDRRIAANVASLIEDGAVLQVGNGALPDQVMTRLHTHRDLGLHSGILTDAVQPLIEAGVINNRTKREHAGVSIATMAGGSARFYDFLDRNDDIRLLPCSITHDARRLASIDGLTAVNSALQIDLLGNVNVERIAGRTIATPGGLPDFARGACRASNGRSILALRSTFKDTSTIVPGFEAGAPIAIEGHDITHLVTEHGIADVRDASPIQRARALIGVAHPMHREALLSQLSLIAKDLP